jgi:hypothetical protein
VIEKASTGAVSPSDLAWHEGIPSWVPLGEILRANNPSSKPMPPPAPIGAATQASGLGLASLLIGIAGFPVWIVILTIAAIFHKQGLDSQDPKMQLVGLGLFAMVGLNAIGVILGMIAVFNKQAKKMSAALGISFNFLQIAGIISLIIIGLAARR